jgi:hypothetical protein
MLDTVNFFVSKELLGHSPFDLECYLDDVETKIKKRTGQATISGKVIVGGKASSYSARLTEQGVYLTGSLSKFFFGDNIQILNHSQIVLALDILGDSLHVPIFEAKVTRIDVGAVFSIKHTPLLYFQYLGRKNKFERLLNSKNTLYYKTDKRKLLFYDKEKEAKKKKMTIPEVFKAHNLLRYELGLMKCLKRQLGFKEIFGATLCDKNFCKELLEIWAKEYLSIEKVKSVSTINVSRIKNINDGFISFFAMYSNQFCINCEQIEKYIAYVKSMKVYKDPKYYSRLKTKLNKLITASCDEEQSPLINELDEAVDKFVREWTASNISKS